jgi:hypothetical protein
LNEEPPDLNELKVYLQNHSELEIEKIKPGIEDRFMQLMKAHPEADTKIENMV